jgi:hypothetical protein
MRRTIRTERPLNLEERALLREVIARQEPQLLEILPAAEQNDLLPEERRRLCALISAEFARSGTGPDFGVLLRGLKLEALLDTFLRPILFPAG